MYHRIFVPIDGSAPADAGLDEAIRLAKSAGGALRLVYVLDSLNCASGFETPSTYFTDVVPTAKRRGEELLLKGRDKAAAAGVSADICLMQCLGSSVADLIIEAAAAWRADLILLGTHARHGIDRLALGSEAESILRRSAVPVLIVKDGPSASTEAAPIAAARASR